MKINAPINFSVNILSIFIFTLTPIIPCFAAAQSAQLQHVVDKYTNSGVSSQALRRLAPYNALIDYYADFSFIQPRHKVSPDFIRALILAESNAEPLAVSTDGAQGLGQIIFSTGKQAAQELSRTSFRFLHVSRHTLAGLTKEDLFDPAVNILLTCYLISKYNEQFNGRLELVLSAWNAGENLAELAMGHPAPYPETHHLIGKVNGYYISLLQKRNPQLGTVRK